MISNFLFYLFATILIISSFSVITAKNPVNAVLSLVAAFVTSSCLWIMLNVEFLALTLILVYVGAVMVLFLFVVMMLEIDVEALRKGFWKKLPLTLFVGLVILGEMLLVLITRPIQVNPACRDCIDSFSNTNYHVLAWMLYTKYSYPIELASMILLLGLVVAIALTLRGRKRDSKYQNISAQVKVNSRDRLELVKLKAEVEEVAIENHENSKEQ